MKMLIIGFAIGMIIMYIISYFGNDRGSFSNFWILIDYIVAFFNLIIRVVHSEVEPILYYKTYNYFKSLGYDPYHVTKEILINELTKEQLEHLRDLAPNKKTKENVQFIIDNYK